jgi:hypothetical protein
MWWYNMRRRWIAFVGASPGRVAVGRSVVRFGRIAIPSNIEEESSKVKSTNVRYTHAQQVKESTTSLLLDIDCLGYRAIVDGHFGVLSWM